MHSPAFGTGAMKGETSIATRDFHGFHQIHGLSISFWQESCSPITSHYSMLRHPEAFLSFTAHLRFHQDDESSATQAKAEHLELTGQPWHELLTAFLFFLANISPRQFTSPLSERRKPHEKASIARLRGILGYDLQDPLILDQWKNVAFSYEKCATRGSCITYRYSAGQHYAGLQITVFFSRKTRLSDNIHMMHLKC